MANDAKEEEEEKSWKVIWLVFYRESRKKKVATRCEREKKSYKRLLTLANGAEPRKFNIEKN